MLTINFYGLMPNPRIQSERIPIYQSLNDILRAMVEGFSNLTTAKDSDFVFNYCFPFKLLQPLEERIAFLAHIRDVFPHPIEQEFADDDSLFQLKTYLVTPNGKVLFVRDFQKVLDNLDFIEKQAVDGIKEDDHSGKKKLEQLQDEMVKLKDNRPTTRDFIVATTVLAYVYQLIDEDIETNRVAIQATMNDCIKEVREREEANAEIRNELDIVNQQIKTILKDPKDLEEDEFEYATYNGRDVSQEEIVQTLTTHVLPDFLVPQIDINETLDDEYRIETKKLIIVRSSGGGLKVTRKG